MPSLRDRRERTAARECQAYTENSWAETFRPVIFIAVIDNGMGFAIIEVRPDKRKSRGLTPVPLNERPESRSDRKIDPCWQLSARAALLRRLVLHYYQFHIGDYASHTAHLDELEDLAYRRMLDYCYLNEIGLPPTVEEIARLIRMRTHCERIANVLREFFVLHDDGVYRQFRVEQQIADFRGKSDKAKQAARKRWEKTDANALPTHSERNANHKPITNNHKPPKTLVADAPEFINADAWNEWLEYRKQSKKKMTAATIAKQHKFLSDYDKQTQSIIINQSIQNGWAGLFEPKGKTNGHIPGTIEQSGFTKPALTVADKLRAKLDTMQRERSQREHD
jgi:uncharacterized protein YdaU (DUF1376 family)